ncbi:MAG: chorismate mutase [Oscillospiraceae bacterium]|nr:chorismate mutase [Oscillospiraceae bacterium]
MMDGLQEARKIINEVDAKMAELFVRRMEAAEMVAEYKREHGMPILDAAREEEVIRNGANRVENDAYRGYYVDFMRDTMAISRRYQQKLLEGMRVAYSGVEGAFAHIAAHKLFPDAEKVAYPDFDTAYDAVVKGECDVVVLPLENSYAGEVGQVTDLLFSGPLYVNGTVAISVTHELLGVEGASLEAVKTVVSHPQALAQCDSFIKKHGYAQMPYENTALAAKYVSDLNDPTVAAIGSAESASCYNLKVLMDGINQSRVNTTRFAVLAKSEDRNITKAHGAHFVLMFTVRNEAGSLARALNIIGAHGFNMRTLRSRPMKELLWEYYFYVEAEGNVRSYEGKCMLEELAVCCDKIKCVGSFN